MRDTYDVVIVGGGFAGVTAARELRQRGHRVLILEARDRLGGRTWVSEFAGVAVEMGGTWVHWTQPYVWSEIGRYNLKIVESTSAERCGWITGGRIEHLPADEYYAILNEAIDRFCHDAHDVFERPFDPLFKPAAVAAIDGESVRDRIEAMNLSRELSDLLDGEWASVGHAPNAEVGVSVPLRWYALSGWDAVRIHEAGGRYMFAGGTRSLIDAMVLDSRPDIRLSSPVAVVEQDGDTVTVTTRDGTSFGARAVVMTAPLNTWNAITFRPMLSPLKQAAAAEGQASRGVKVWARVRGELAPFFGTAPDAHGLNWVGTQFSLPGATLVVGFGATADAFDMTDPAAVQSSLREFFPTADVEEAGGHDWVADEFSRGTWPVFRPYQLSRYLAALQQSEGRVFMAGSETANGWSGFIDGAIESGLTAARQVATLLAGHASRA